ncbi:hypothetical protein L7F22_006914 [Adiantum nelumboides]|nr:hypothetical protein [Adiantum nelumboides]
MREYWAAQKQKRRNATVNFVMESNTGEMDERKKRRICQSMVQHFDTLTVGMDASGRKEIFDELLQYPCFLTMQSKSIELEAIMLRNIRNILDHVKVPRSSDEFFVKKSAMLMLVNGGSKEQNIDMSIRQVAKLMEIHKRNLYSAKHNLVVSSEFDGSFRASACHRDDARRTHITHTVKDIVFQFWTDETRVSPNKKDVCTDEEVRYIRVAFDKIKESIQYAQQKYKRAADKNRKSLQFKDGDWVLLQFTKAQLKTTTGKNWKGEPTGHQKYYMKLAERYYGPFQILSRINETAYKLRLPANWHIHNAFHVRLLKPFKGDPPTEPVQEEPPLFDDKEEVLQPEEILRHEENTLRSGKSDVCAIRISSRLRYYMMSFENVTTVPHFSFGSELGSKVCLLSEIPGAHIKSAKLLRSGEVSCGGGVLPTLPLYQILEVLHGKHSNWQLQGARPSKAAARSSLVFADKHWQGLRVDASGTYSRKLTKSAPGSIHGPSGDIINTLPNELLCHIFHYLATSRDRVACSSVSKRWLMLQSHMLRGSFVHEVNGVSCLEREYYTECNTQEAGVCGESDEDDGIEAGQQRGRGGDLSRCLSGRKASDVRLAAIALGTEMRGGLGKLCIRGGSSGTGLEVTMTDVGLSAIGSWCSGLRVLSLWNCPYIIDEGLCAIGKGCPLLEKVDLYRCPLLGDTGLQVIAKSCPGLSFLNLDECENVGDNALVAFAERCFNLTTLNVQNCPQVLVLLALHNLDQVTAEGFAFLGKGPGMPALKHLHVSNCKSFTDYALAMVASHCCSLRNLHLLNCEHVSDKGLVFFMKVASCVQVLHLERCNLITGTGLIVALSGRGKGLRELQVRKCEGLQQVQAICPHIPLDTALESVCLADCPGVSDLLVALVGLLSPEASSIDFSGLSEITDDGLLAFLCGSRKLTSLNLSGCANVTDRSLCTIIQQCGQNIRSLVLDGCKRLTDKTLKAISSHCPFLEDLDVSECAISDAGLKVLVDNAGQVLTSLNLSGCVGISDITLPFIYKSCDSLLDLNIKNCTGLSEKGGLSTYSQPQPDRVFQEMPFFAVPGWLGSGMLLKQIEFQAPEYHQWGYPNVIMQQVSTRGMLSRARRGKTSVAEQGEARLLLSRAR